MDSDKSEVCFHCMRELIANTLSIPIEHIHPTSTFASLGADSLESAALVIELEEALDCRLDFAKVSTTLQQIIDWASGNGVVEVPDGHQPEHTTYIQQP